MNATPCTVCGRRASWSLGADGRTVLACHAHVGEARALFAPATVVDWRRAKA